MNWMHVLGWAGGAILWILAGGVVVWTVRKVNPAYVQYVKYDNTPYLLKACIIPGIEMGLLWPITLCIGALVGLVFVLIFLWMFTKKVIKKITLEGSGKDGEVE